MTVYTNFFTPPIVDGIDIAVVLVGELALEVVLADFVEAVAEGLGEE